MPTPLADAGHQLHRRDPASASAPAIDAKGKRTAIVAIVSGDANRHFFRELARRGAGTASIPAMPLPIDEAELSAQIPPEVRPARPAA